MTEAKLGMALDDIIMRDSEQRRGGKDRRRREPERRNPYSRVKDEDDGYRSTLQRRNHNRRRDDDEDEQYGDEFVKVGSNSVVKSVAGRIAHATRDGAAPTVLAIGSACINTAVKAVAVARTYLKEDDNLDLTCQPAFRDKKMQKSLALCLHKSRLGRPSKSASRMFELTVSSLSKPEVVAGALAARVRESKEVCLTAIGVDAVANALRAICHARMYLEEDHVDIKCLPEFIEIEKEDQTLNGIQFNILVLQL